MLIIDGHKANEVIKINSPITDLQDMPSQTEINSPTELGEVLRELNNDELSPATRMSGIDMRSRLHYIEISGILAVDSLVQFRLLPVSCLSFTRQKKRLSVSLNGEGRNDFVKIVGGKHDQDAKVGVSFADRFKGLIGGQPKDV
jgi:hypothetical protein